MTRATLEGLFAANEVEYDIERRRLRSDVRVPTSSFCPWTDEQVAACRSRGITAVLVLSRPFYDLDHDKAYVVACPRRGWLNAECYLFVFDARDDRWILKNWALFCLQ